MGKNLFHGGRGPEGMTREAEAFAAGVLEAMPALTGITAPSVVSYERLQPHRWAGPWACWGRENREAALRFVTGMVGSRADAANLEVKAMDAAANPYLALGGIVAAGLDGLDRDLHLPEPVLDDPADISARKRRAMGIRRLPDSLSAAIRGAGGFDAPAERDGRRAVRLVPRDPPGGAQRVRGEGRRRGGPDPPLALLRGATMAKVDLSDARIVDAHTHPYRLEDLQAKDSAGFDTRMMFLGESFLSSSQMDAALWPVADAFTDSTVFALAMRRWLADHLGCEPTRAAVTAARAEAIRADATAYTKGLMDAAGIVAILSDEGTRSRRSRRPSSPRRPASRSTGSPASSRGSSIGAAAPSTTWSPGWRRTRPRRRGPELRRVQVDRRLPDRAGRG